MCFLPFSGFVLHFLFLLCLACLQCKATPSFVALHCWPGELISMGVHISWHSTIQDWCFKFDIIKPTWVFFATTRYIKSEQHIHNHTVLKNAKWPIKMQPAKNRWICLTICSNIFTEQSVTLSGINAFHCTTVDRKHEQLFYWSMINKVATRRNYTLLNVTNFFLVRTPGLCTLNTKYLSFPFHLYLCIKSTSYTAVLLKRQWKKD